LIQTFFHEALDAGVQPPGGESGRLDTALGETRTFLLGPAGGGFTLPDFRSWVEGRVTVAADADVLAFFDWLPPEIEVVAGSPLPTWVRGRASELLQTLEGHAARLASGGQLAAGTEFLLDFLFDAGLLPTYAFPTNLASFLVERPGEMGRIEVVERPQQAVNQALSEYAPGRLVVIDKVTYRSGGVTANVPPTDVDRAAPLFDRAIDYVCCRNCSFVGPPVRPVDSVPDECPICGESGALGRTPMITPEVFHPEEGRPVRPNDREQDYTYASTAQFPVPVDGRDVPGWRRYGDHAELTYARSQPLVVVNRGEEQPTAGFWVCDRCGAASLADGGPPTRHPHRPYFVQRVPNQPPPGHCRGQHRQVYIGNQFKSDLMLLRVTLDPPFHHNTDDRVFLRSLEDAVLTLSEALVLGASLSLQIDPAEFSAGFRHWHRTADGRLRFDIYIFDTLSGGAGYSEETGRELGSVLAETGRLLAGCNCATSCQNCLRHYGNRIHHEQFDRFYALQLLNYITEGVFPAIGDHALQVEQLQALERMFRLDGYAARRGVVHHGVMVPLLVTRGDQSVAIGTYPGLLDQNAMEFEHPLTAALDGAAHTHVHLERDYRLTRNLPGAYQEARQFL
jgi:hypothetical protein